MQADARASSTALLIAASIVLQDEQGIAEGILPAETIRLSRHALHAAGWPWRQVGMAVRFRFVRAAFAALERHTLPGIQAHYLLRKKRMAVWAEQALSDGFRQILILGAGFDGLAPGLAQRDPGVLAIEWDHPATQAFKREALRSAQVEPENLRLQGIDIARDDAIAALAASGLRRDVPTLIVAEGLLMYLPRERCEQLLDSFRDWFAGTLRIAFSYMEPDAQGEPGFAHAKPSVSRWLQRRGEPFLWACARTSLIEKLMNEGMRVIDSDDACQVPEPPMPNWVACPGETLCLAEAVR
jgi:methyltransferase (TIGR00027 family)